MPRYKVKLLALAKVSVSSVVEVDAKNEKQAKEFAIEEAHTNQVDYWEVDSDIGEDIDDNSVEVANVRVVG